MSVLGWRERFALRRVAAGRGRGAAPLRRLRRRPSPRLLLGAALLVALLAGCWLWLRDSSLVAIKRVTVVGATGPDAARIRAVLTRAARNMTTLDVRIKTLQMAVAPFPVVKALHVSTQFPHGVRISVVEEAPVGVITAGGSSVAVAADGTLLPSATSTANLPQIPVRVPPGGSRVSDPGTRAVVALLAAAPWQLLAHVAQASQQPGHGLVALLRNGPAIYFGTDSQLTAKWAAAAAVLADARSAGAQYIDVSDPGRPAAGTTTTSSTTTGSTAATATGSTGATTTPNGGTITPPAAGAAGASAAGTTGAPAAASPTGGG